MTTNGGRAIRSAVHRAYVWAVWSVENRATCESLWASNLKDQISLTIMTEDAPLSDDLGLVLDLAIEHHGSVTDLEIVGYDDGAEADRIASEYAYARDRDSSDLIYQHGTEPT